MLALRACLFVAVVFIVGANDVLEASSRQKRCIVVQKQTGLGSRDSDDDDDDYRLPQPKDPRPDRIRDEELKRSEVEDIPAKLLQLNSKPKWLNRLMLRNKFLRDQLNSKFLSQ